MTPRFVVTFDSAAAMVRALGCHLHGRGFRGPVGSRPLTLLLPAINRLPVPIRQALYTWGGWLEGVRPARLGQVRSEDVSRWVVDLFPERRHPAVVIGSSNGAGVHLAAAIGAPWLPQTVLMLVRRHGVGRDDPAADMEWGRAVAGPLLEANPDWTLHHMHDPVQDRLMLRHATYFRTKRLRLGPAYERFLSRALSPGGTIVLLDCGLTWPTTRVGDRHVFQLGAEGGLHADEYRQRWGEPAADGASPEAEWGFEPALADDVVAFARKGGYRVVRIAFDQPEDLSAPVAELHRRWYRSRGIEPSRLVVASFALLDPWWTLRAGAVPYWSVFSVKPSVARLTRYLDGAEPYDHVDAMLFSHGVESPGAATIADWQTALDRARIDGGFLGVDPDSYPRDFSAFVDYARALQRLPGRFTMPDPLDLSAAEHWLTDAGGGAVTVQEVVPASSRP